MNNFNNLENYDWVAGIYAIKNRISEKVYVGSSENIRRRVGNHLGYLRNGNHPNRYLQESWNSNGEESFETLILEKVEDVSLLLEKEQ